MRIETIALHSGRKPGPEELAPAGASVDAVRLSVGNGQIDDLIEDIDRTQAAT